MIPKNRDPSNPERARFEVNIAPSQPVVPDGDSFKVTLRVLGATTVHLLVSELERRRWKTKSWTSKSGLKHSGRAFTKASLHRLLTNAVYAGNVEHRGAIYAGEHAAIVEPSAWEPNPESPARI